MRAFRFSARVSFASAALASLALHTSPAHAANLDAATRAWAGKGVVAVHVDLAAGVVHHKACAAAPCVADGSSPVLRIGIDKARMPDAKDVVVAIVPIAEGHDVIHVRIPERGTGPSVRGRAWEAVLAPGAGEPIFAGVTGLTAGDEGERHGTMVQTPERDAATRVVVVGDIREDLRLCGQEATPLSPRVLDPATLQLRGATMQRLTREQRAGARRVVASARAGASDAPEAPLARLLVATGSSADANDLHAPSPAALTDGKTTTAWFEARPGDGRGEFVVMRAPEEVPITRLAITVMPDSRSANARAPRSFFLVTETATVAVTLPDDGGKKTSSSYDIPLADPLRSSCLAIVLDEAYTRGEGAPDVTVAELVAYSEFDASGGSFAAATAALAGGGPRANAAAGVLTRAGSAGFDAVASAYDTLDAQGRALAVDVAGSVGACDKAAMLYVKAVGDADTEVARKARGHLQRCGETAGPALAAAVQGADVPRRTTAAPLLASIAPKSALEPLASVMGEGPAETRAAVRSALARAVGRASEAQVSTLFARATAAEKSPVARLDFLRALTPTFTAHRAEASRLVESILAEKPNRDTRYLAIDPLADLARVGEGPARTHLVTMLTSDDDGAVRAHAASVLANVPSVGEPLVAAANDASPRVREAALRSLSTQHDGHAVDAARARLAKDGWPFVRIAAIELLAGAGPSEPADGALGEALADPSPRARSASIGALAARHAGAFAPALQKRMDDAHEDIDVRVAAAQGLGAMCAVASQDRLTALARSTLSDAADEAQMQLGLAALAALGVIHPNDLATRIGPLLAKGARPEVQRLAEATLRQPSGCGQTSAGVVRTKP